MSAKRIITIMLRQKKKKIERSSLKFFPSFREKKESEWEDDFCCSSRTQMTFFMCVHKNVQLLLFLNLKSRVFSEQMFTFSLIVFLPVFGIQNWSTKSEREGEKSW